MVIKTVGLYKYLKLNINCNWICMYKLNPCNEKFMQECLTASWEPISYSRLTNDIFEATLDRKVIILFWRRSFGSFWNPMWISSTMLFIFVETAMGITRKTQDESGFDYAMAVMK